MPQESPAESSATKRGSVAQRSAIEDQAALMALASKMHFEKKRRRQRGQQAWAAEDVSWTGTTVRDLRVDGETNRSTASKAHKLQRRCEADGRRESLAAAADRSKGKKHREHGKQ